GSGGLGGSDLGVYMMILTAGRCPNSRVSYGSW
ncbi:hypothetical protein Tco_0912091, partial [Tanacetum coccineum]